MEVKNAPGQRTTGYNGLTEHRQALPAHYYFDRAHYERELRRIWFRNWVYVGRSEELQAPRSFRTFEIGDQRILLVRDDAGQLHGGGVGLAGLIGPADADLVAGVVLLQHRGDLRR